jgi:hypothetical protein
LKALTWTLSCQFTRVGIAVVLKSCPTLNIPLKASPIVGNFSIHKPFNIQYVVQLAFIALSLLGTFQQISALPANELVQRDLVHDVVILLELLHASAFCSSFAPQPTAVVTGTKANTSILPLDANRYIDTVHASQTVTTTSTSTLVAIVCNHRDYKRCDSYK